MKQLHTIFGATLIACFLFSACNNKNTEDQKTTSTENSNENKIKAEQALRVANDQFYAALNAMFIGNLEPMNAIWSHGKEVTDMGPFGGRLESWAAVGAEFQKEASMKLGGKIVCKDLLVHAGTDMGYTVCTEEGENMSADGKPVVVRFRATNVFRLENNQWKMVHHHTDLSTPLQEGTGAEAK
ncbi:MAG: nuclear transport factor 2 family protein [Ferruginibacter sp.]